MMVPINMQRRPSYGRYPPTPSPGADGSGHRGLGAARAGRACGQLPDQAGQVHRAVSTRRAGGHHGPRLCPTAGAAVGAKHFYRQPRWWWRHCGGGGGCQAGARRLRFVCRCHPPLGQPFVARQIGLRHPKRLCAHQLCGPVSGVSRRQPQCASQERARVDRAGQKAGQQPELCVIGQWRRHALGGRAL